MFPPTLKPLLIVVIVLAIAHTLLKFRARAAARSRTRTAKSAPKPPIQRGPAVARTAEDALAELHRAAQERH